MLDHFTKRDKIIKKLLVCSAAFGACYFLFRVFSRSKDTANDMDTVELTNDVEITALFAKHIPKEIILIENRTKGWDQQVHFILCNDGSSYILKQAKNCVNISSEVKGVAHAQKLGIPAPQVLYYGKNHLIETVIQGNDLTEINNPPLEVYHAIGRCLKKLHTVQMDHYGVVDKENFETLYDSVMSYHGESLEELLRREFFDLQQCVKIRKYFDAHKNYLQSSKAVLLHGDISDDNLMSDGTKLTGIIDWADLEAGVPEAEFACAYASLMDQQAYDALVEGYGGIDQQKVNYFAAIRLTWIIAGASDYPQERIELYNNIINENCESDMSCVLGEVVDIS